VGLFFEIQRRGKEQDRRGKRRATVAPPPAPPSFLPATTTAPSSCHHQRCQRQQNQRGRRETEQKQRITLRREGEPQSKQLPQFPDCHQHCELSAAQPRQREEDVVDRDNSNYTGWKKKEQRQREKQRLRGKDSNEKKRDRRPLKQLLRARPSC
jgi:hypothetical protein